MRLLPIAVGLLAAVLFTPAVGLPHAELVRSAPARRAVVSRPPARVQLWFTERLETGFSEVSVWNAAGTRVDTGDVQVGPEDEKRLSVGLPALPPGVYTVRYRVLSVDGHVVEREFPFTVREAQPATGPGKPR